MKNQKGFTLIEMLIVLAVISTLLILLVPNLANKNNTVQDKGCEALKSMAESQLVAYNIDTGNDASDITTLINAEYLKTDTCANGTKQAILDGRKVEIVSVTSGS